MVRTAGQEMSAKREYAVPLGSSSPIPEHMAWPAAGVRSSQRKHRGGSCRQGPPASRAREPMAVVSTKEPAVQALAPVRQSLEVLGLLPGGLRGQRLSVACGGCDAMWDLPEADRYLGIQSFSLF